MLYAYKVIDGTLYIQHIGGLSQAEEQRTIDAGWTTYWTTDSRAYRDAVRLSGRNMAN